MPVNWGMGVMPDIGGNAMRAFDQGREQRQQEQGRNALSAYATDQSEANLNALAPHNPQFVMQQKQQMQKQQQDSAEQQLLGDALANPDPQARSAARQRLAYVNHEEYQKLGADQRKQADEGMKAIGQLAFNILQQPPEQQGPALAEALRGLQSQGMDVSGLDLSQGPERVLMSALAMTGQLDQWEQFKQPKYSPVGDGGVAGFQFGKPIQQNGQAQNFGPAAPQGVTFTPLDGGPASQAPGGFRQP